MLDGKGQPVSCPLTASKIHNLGIYADWQLDGTLKGPGSGTNAMCCTILADLHAVHRAKKDPHAPQAPDGQLRQGQQEPHRFGAGGAGDIGGSSMLSMSDMTNPSHD